VFHVPHLHKGEMTSFLLLLSLTHRKSSGHCIFVHSKFFVGDVIYHQEGYSMSWQLLLCQNVATWGVMYTH